MTMRWGVVTDKPQEFLSRSLSRTPQGYTYGVSSDYVTRLCKDFGFGESMGSNTLNFQKPDDNDTILDESGQRRHRQLLGRLLWLDRLDVKNASGQCQSGCGASRLRPRGTPVLGTRHPFFFFLRDSFVESAVCCTLAAPCRYS